MTNITKKSLLLASALASTYCMPAFAQDASGASSSADIIVTARRVEERLQDVPISMTVFNQEQLTTRNVVSANDLATYTPSLSVNTRFGSDFASYSIRGFVQDLRTTASVGVYFADVVAPRGGGSTQGGDGAGPGSFFDLQNVQVLKGPQGTLFGRNTTGGAVLIVPKKPTDSLEGYVEGSLGNYDMRRVQAVINVPLADTFKVRAGMDWQKRDGYLRNVTGIGPKDFANTNYFAGRLSIVGDLTPDLENYTIFSYSKSKPNGAIPKVTDCFTDGVGTFGQPGFVPPPNVGGIMMGSMICPQLARDTGWNTVESTLPNAVQETQQWQAVNTTTWKASDALTIKNIASYSELRQRQHVDLFGARFFIPSTIGFYNRNTGAISNVPLSAVGLGSLVGQPFIFVPAESIPGRYSNKQSTFTEELQLQGVSAGGRLNWQAGAYYEQSSPLGFAGNQNATFMSCSDSGNFQCVDYLGQILTTVARSPTPIPIGTLGYQAAETKFRNVGLYAQANYDLTDRLKLTVGGRYTWDKTTSLAEKVTYRFLTPNVATAFCTNPLLRSPSSPLPDLSATSLCRVTQRQTSEAPTWVVGLDYKPNQDILLYAKYARGYRQGATQPFGPDGLDTYEPEKVDTYEVGAKTSFNGAVSGTFNVSGFYNNFSNQQVTAAYNTPLITGLAPNAGVVNVGKSRIYGAEVEATLIPFEGLRLQGSYAYLNSKVQSLAPLPVVPNFGPATYLTTVGSPLTMTPKHKLSIDAGYTLPLDESIGRITFGTTFSYTGKMLYSGPTSAATGALIAAAGRTSAYYIQPISLWNLNASWNNVMHSNIDASFFMTNVANKHYYLAKNLQATSGFIAQYLSEPRMWGFRLRYSY